MRKVRLSDVEAIAVLIAALAGLVLHLLHAANTELLLTIVMVALAGILLRDLTRQERELSQVRELADLTSAVRRLEESVRVPGAVLVGPHELRVSSEAFAANARGEMLWFNVCLAMFQTQRLFDAMLRSAIENQRVTSIRFVLREDERGRWERDLVPKIEACEHGTKVAEPHWCDIDAVVSFVMSAAESSQREAQLSFWGEPFMARAAGVELPRFVFHLPPHSDLLPHLLEMERKHRLSSPA